MTGAESAVLTTAADAAARAFLPKLLPSVAGPARLFLEKNSLNVVKHLNHSYRSNAFVKLLCSYDEPIYLPDIYVRSKCRFKDKVVDDEEIVAQVRENKRIVINANAGAGKTFLMRYIWLTIFTEPGGRFPVYLELRRLNRLSKLELASLVRSTAFPDAEVSQEAFESMCRDGLFILILDGFDEIDREKREQAEEQVLAISHRFPEMGLIVSGRMEDRFGSWPNFSIYRTEPFDRTQLLTLIGNVPFNEGVKRKFEKLVTAAFFQEHQAFLSNPLLGLMMLMTYRDFAEIPNRLNVFYENCYVTLYSRHDALKDQYRRERKIEQDLFRRLLCLFCLFSYLEEKFSLDEYELRAYAEQASKFVGTPVNIDDFIHEMEVSVNLVQREGMQFTFIHRSFQEYFAAFCATQMLTEKAAHVLRLFAERPYDSALQLSYQIHPILVQEKYYIPLYEELVAAGAMVTSTYRRQRFSALSAVGAVFGIQFEVFLRDGQACPIISMFWPRFNDRYNKFCLGLVHADESLSYNDFHVSTFDLFRDGVLDKFGTHASLAPHSERAVGELECEVHVRPTGLSVLVVSRDGNEKHLDQASLELEESLKASFLQCLPRVEKAMISFNRRDSKAIQQMQQEVEGRRVALSEALF